MVAGNLVHKLRSLMGGNAERVALTANNINSEVRRLKKNSFQTMVQIVMTWPSDGSNSWPRQPPPPFASNSSRSVPPSYATPGAFRSWPWPLWPWPDRPGGHRPRRVAWGSPWRSGGRSRCRRSRPAAGRSIAPAGHCADNARPVAVGSRLVPSSAQCSRIAPRRQAPNQAEQP